MLLPGAPYIFCNSKKVVDLVSDTRLIASRMRPPEGPSSKMTDSLELMGNALRPCIAEELSAHFNSLAGETIRSFASFPLGFSQLRDGDLELALQGVLNIHSSETDIFTPETARSFAQLIQPFLDVMARLVLLINPPSEFHARVSVPVTSSPVEEG